MDNSGCQIRGTGTRVPIDFQQSSFFLLHPRAIQSTTAISDSEYLQVFAYHSYWHCSHSVRSRVYERHGVRPSVRLSVPARAHCSKRAAAGLLLWARRAGDIDRLQHQRAAGECGKCHGSSSVVAEHRLFKIRYCYYYYAAFNAPCVG